MNPYMIDKLAAAHRDDLLSAAERHGRLVQAGCNRGPARRTSTAVVTTIGMKMSKLFTNATDGPNPGAAWQYSSGDVRPSPW
jgi:hypothetical protein